MKTLVIASLFLGVAIAGEKTIKFLYKRCKKSEKEREAGNGTDR